MFNEKIHYTWPFSIAMLVITRGYLENIHFMRTSRHILLDVLRLNGVESSRLGDIWFMTIRTGFLEQGLVQYHRHLVYPRKSNVYLVVGLEHVLFSHILGIVTPSDFHIFQRGRLQPPTSYAVRFS